MRPILRVEILPNPEYAARRDVFRSRIIEAKKRRRVILGEHMSAVFENRDTVHLQIQEMLRAEGIIAESAVMHEIETYNELVPGDEELSLTLFVEIPDRETRERLLVELARLELHVHVEIDGARFAFTGKREGASDERTTAVHYLKAKPSRDAMVAVASRRAKVAVVVDHPNYAARAELGDGALRSLAEDLG